ncbi:methylmalonyl-CoA mutase family protein [Streptomyces sp. CG1]|uniref:methylmalonyl-CoA mutase family protein n=1 Tax=Streptomyces sp. CG1 TaxID=1287523 RepID=UPI0034E2B1B9
MPDRLLSPATSSGRRSRPVCRYAGRGTAKEANARYRRLIAHGATGLSVAFDLPTRLGLDSDAPLARGQVGRAGVAVDSLDDMRVLFAGIPLDEVATSMTVDAPAALLLLLYQLVAEERGIPADRLTGTVQNDVPGACVTRGTSVFPPSLSLRLTADVFTYGKAEMPRWNTMSLSGRLMAEAGACRAQESAELGDGAVATAEHGFQQREIEARQAERLAKLRAWRDQERVHIHITDLQKAAAGPDNVLYPMKDALAAGATVGEICDALRETWGTYGEEP